MSDTSPSPVVVLATFLDSGAAGIGNVDAKSLLREVLPRNLQDNNGSEARTRVFLRSKGTPTLKSVVLGEVWDNR